MPPTTLGSLSATTQRIYDAIAANPGLGKGDLAERCQVAPGTVALHLERLVAKGAVFTFQDGPWRRVFPQGYPAPVARVYSALHRDVTRQILQALSNGKPWTRRELLATLGVPESTLANNLAQLHMRGMLQREFRRGRHYYQAVDVHLLRATLVGAEPAPTRPA